MESSRKLLAPAGIALVALIASWANFAQAQPQVLAMVATEGDVELRCHGNACRAEFTTFCLQADRFSPVRGTRYTLASGGEMRLSGITRDGREVVLDPGAHLIFESLRTHLALRVSILREQMDALGLERVALSVGDDVSLVPEGERGEAPFPEGELTLVTGPLRVLGSAIVDGNGERMVAARITNRMINALPEGGPSGVGEAEGAWRQAVGGPAGASLPPGAVKKARDALELCDYVVSSGNLGSIRRCLQTKHDGFVDFLNSKYWKAVKTGS